MRHNQLDQPSINTVVIELIINKLFIKTTTFLRNERKIHHLIIIPIKLSLQKKFNFKPSHLLSDLRRQQRSPVPEQHVDYHLLGAPKGEDPPKGEDAPNAP